jgi:hypothetical protein
MKAISGLAAAVLCLTAGNNAVSGTAVWTTNSLVSSVEVVNDGTFLVKLVSGVGSGCTQANAIFVVTGQNGLTADGVKAQLATAEAALIAGRTLSIMYDNTTPWCYGAFMVMQ